MRRTRFRTRSPRSSARWARRNRSLRCPGQRLDKDEIMSKAIKKGVAKEDGSYSDQEIFQFIFLPGFSTAKKVTDVSGRGVGMDVVRRNIQTLRGSVEIESERGKGTTFSIMLPLTLAIIDGMVVRVHEEEYIIPTMSIVESIKPRAEHTGNTENRRV